MQRLLPTLAIAMDPSGPEVLGRGWKTEREEGDTWGTRVSDVYPSSSTVDMLECLHSNRLCYTLCSILCKCRRFHSSLAERKLGA
jgi:hypothetical protein